MGGVTLLALLTSTDPLHWPMPSNGKPVRSSMVTVWGSGLASPSLLIGSLAHLVLPWAPEGVTPEEGPAMALQSNSVLTKAQVVQMLSVSAAWASWNSTHKRREPRSSPCALCARKLAGQEPQSASA